MGIRDILLIWGTVQNKWPLAIRWCLLVLKSDVLSAVGVWLGQPVEAHVHTSQDVIIPGSQGIGPLTHFSTR